MQKSVWLHYYVDIIIQNGGVLVFLKGADTWKIVIRHNY